MGREVRQYISDHIEFERNCERDLAAQGKEKNPALLYAKQSPQRIRVNSFGIDRCEKSKRGKPSFFTSRLERDNTILKSNQWKEIGILDYRGLDEGAQ